MAVLLFIHSCSCGGLKTAWTYFAKGVAGIGVIPGTAMEAKHENCYRAFSLTWPASMLIYWNKVKHLHERRVQLPEDFLSTPTWLPFHCFGTPNGRRDVI